MKILAVILTICLLHFSTYAQQATEIDSKSVKLPRYPHVVAIESIPDPQHGMMVYNLASASTMYYNDTRWKGIVSAPMSLYHETTLPSQTTFSAIEAGTNSGSGNFSIDNSLNPNPALRAHTWGNGDAIFATTSGSGYSLRATSHSGKPGFFEIGTATNHNTALHALTYGNGAAFYAQSLGSGNAGYFSGTRALETDGQLRFAGSGVGVIANGKVLTSDALGNATWQNSTLTLPLAQTLASSNPLLSLTNTGANGAGNFQIDNNINANNALVSTTNGIGSAAKFNITNPTSSAAVIEAESLGSGFAGSFQGTSSLETSGFVKFKGFTQLGELSPKIKTVEFNQYIGAGSVETITHNLNAGKILSINVYASLETGLPPYMRISPSFISLGTEYYYDYYFDDTKIYFIIPSASTKVKNFYARVLINYKE